MNNFPKKKIPKKIRILDTLAQMFGLGLFESREAEYFFGDDKKQQFCHQHFF
jgi:hypothetical protein